MNPSLDNSAQLNAFFAGTQLSDTQICKAADAMGDFLVDCFDKAMTGAVNKLAEQGQKIGTSAMAKVDSAAAGLSAKASPPTVPARSQEIQKDLGPQQIPQLAQDAARSAVAGLDMPKYGFPQPAVHVAAADLSQQVGQSALTVGMSNEMARNQQQQALG